MPVNGTNNQPKSVPAGRTTTQPKSVPAGRADGAKAREGFTKVGSGSVSYARQTAERTVDVPVGAALTVAERLTDIVEPFTGRQSANRELNAIRTRVERELNRLERRGATARRKTRTRVRRTRGRVERGLTRRRRRVQATVKQNRTRAEGGVKRAQSAVQERVSTLV
jgi:hypothetical protein